METPDTGRRQVLRTVNRQYVTANIDAGAIEECSKVWDSELCSGTWDLFLALHLCDSCCHRQIRIQEEGEAKALFFTGEAHALILDSYHPKVSK